ncbi:MAG: alpha/beta fold hydrolase [Anaerolineae bacterium]|nr:alpha/beta fold hydrolase [Anaerolineae bacterium]
MIKKSSPKNYWRNILLFLLAALFIGYLCLQLIAYPYLTASAHTHPSRQSPCCETPADFGLDYEEVTFETANGLTLHGWYIPGENEAAVMLLHGINGNRLSMLGLAKGLAEAGYGVLLFDLRGHGDSDGDIVPYGGPEAEDVVAAAAYLQARPDVDPERIGALGWSLGAQVVIMGAAQDENVKAVVADGPGATAVSDWPPPETLNEWLYVPVDFMYYQFLPMHTGVTEPLALIDVLPMLGERPLLLISSGDSFERHRMDYFLNHATDPKELLVFAESDHIGGWRDAPEVYETNVINFFDKALLQP